MGFFDRFFGPPSEDRFAKIMADALRRAGDDRDWTYDTEEFRLLHMKDGKEAGVTNLRNLYTEYCKAPKKDRDAMLARTCKGLLNPMEMPDEFDDVKPDILPTVRTRSMLEVLRLDAQLAGGNSFELPSLPLTDHLVVCLVYDLPTSMRFVTDDNLSTWGVTLFEAFEVARQNLEERPYTMLSIGEKLYVLESGDAYDGTRVLMTEPIRQLKLTGQPVAMPITRDCLLITGAEDVDGLTLMLAIANQKDDEPRPLCPIPMRLNGDEWETWLLPANHALAGQFRELQLKYLAGAYADQKPLLEKWTEKSGDDVFVASFTIIKRDEQLRNFSVWTKTVPTWLPKSEYVALYDPETKQQQFVRWERLQEVVGDTMQPLDYYPPRFFVDEFPTDEQIAQMQPENWAA